MATTEKLEKDYLTEILHKELQHAEMLLHDIGRGVEVLDSFDNIADAVETLVRAANRLAPSHEHKLRFQRH